MDVYPNVASLYEYKDPYWFRTNPMNPEGVHGLAKQLKDFFKLVNKQHRYYDPNDVTRV